MFKYLVLYVLIAAGFTASAIDVSNRYRSPRNPERNIRASTQLIILHTTEAPARSSLNKLSERGECHFVVTEDGSVYRIVDRDREAFHAGRSMWNGKEDVDKFSVGIECVGYHDKTMPLAQLQSIRDLVKELKSMYHLTDDKVIAHSHVAYGAPNRWQKRRHRGRKRCGMLFATPTIRRLLELKTRPASDPDVRAKRLVVADEYLNTVLYGKGDFMRGKYPASVVAAQRTKESGIFSWIGRAKPEPKPTKPTTVVKATPAAPVRQPSPVRATIPRSIADLKAQGYQIKGAVTQGRTASTIAGSKWNAADTYYTIRNKVVPGNTIDPAHIEKGMCVWMKKK